MQRYILLLREHSLYQRTREVDNFEDYQEETEIFNTGYLDYFRRFNVEYYFGLNTDWQGILPIFEIGSNRGGIEDYDGASHVEPQWPLLKLLVDPGSFEEPYEKLSQIEPFQFLSEGWQDDEIFRNGLDRACDWHLEKSLRCISGEDERYDGPAVTLVPTWIFALDKRRAEVVGRSALPDNPLIELAQGFLDQLRKDYKSDPSIAKLEAITQGFLKEIEPVDLPAFWKAFIKT